MVLPSGEKCGFDVRPWKLVRRRAIPPARSTVQMLFAYANAIAVALTLGVRSRRVGTPLEMAAGGENMLSTRTGRQATAASARRRFMNRPSRLLTFKLQTSDFPLLLGHPGLELLVPIEHHLHLAIRRRRLRLARANHSDDSAVGSDVEVPGDCRSCIQQPSSLHC